MGEEPISGPEPMRGRFFETLIEMLDGVFRPGDPRSMGEDYPYFLRPENFENLFIFRAGDRVLSHVGVLPTTLSLFGHPVPMGMIGAVATHPQFRGRGLATRLLRRTFEHARRRGMCLLLISGGRGLYRRAGARSVGTFQSWRLPSAARPEAGLEVSPATRCDIPSLIALHRCRPLRFVRPREEWRLNLEAGRCQGHPVRFALVRRRGAPVAYLAHPREPDSEGDYRVMEWGGDLGAALPAVGAVCPGEPGPTRWLLYPHQLGASRALREAGAALQETVSLYGTLVVLDFRRLMNALGGYLGEVLGTERAGELAFGGGEDDTFTIRQGAEKLRIGGRGTLAEVLFGAGPGALPREPPPGRLRATLEKLLPLPAPRHDLTYA